MFFLVTCIALVIIILIASFAVKLDPYTACFMLGVWRIAHIVER